MIAFYCILIDRKDLYNEVANAIVENNNNACYRGYNGYIIDKGDVNNCIRYLTTLLPKNLDDLYNNEITEFKNSFAKDSD